MQTFFVIDSVDNLQQKIDLISNNIGDDIKFFVKTSLFTKINNNSFVINNLLGIYEKNEKEKIDEYIKSEKFNLDSIFLYYASVSVSVDTLKTIHSKMSFGYDSIFVEPKRNVFEKFTTWCYDKISQLVFRVKDACCSTKVQYLSKNFVEHLKQTSFNNHILDVPFSYKVSEQDKSNCKSLQDKIKFSKFLIYDLIALFSIIAFYIVLETFFKLRFYVYFAVVIGIIMTFVIGSMIIVNSKFNVRYKLKKRNIDNKN